MIAFLRLALMLFIVMTVVYFLLAIYARSVAREELEKSWDETHPGDPDSPVRDAYIEEGMRSYERSLRRKLLASVFLLPAVAIGVVMYLVNTY